MGSRFLELPGELRNAIYEYSFNIQYESMDDSKSLKWSIPPRYLVELFLVCKQVYQEASSLFYQEVFPHFEFRPIAFKHLYMFTPKVPAQHRGKFKASINILTLNGHDALRQLGLGRSLPWEIDRQRTEEEGPLSQTERRLRGDCFLLTCFSSYGGFAGVRHDYDRIKMVGHLGRLQWTTDEPPQIVYRPPLSKNKLTLLDDKPALQDDGPSFSTDEPPRSSQRSFGSLRDFKTE